MISALLVAGIFSGQWYGTGLMYQDGKRVSPCDQVTFEFVHKPDSLQTLSGVVNCGPMRIRSSPKTVQIVNGRLIFNGADVGSITENEIISEYWDSKAKWKQLFHLQIIDSQLHYLEKVTLDNGYEYYRVEAILGLK